MDIKKTIIFLSTTLLLLIGTSHAADYYSCKDSSGRTTFSQQPCSDSAELKSIKVYTPDIPKKTARKSLQVTEDKSPDSSTPAVYKEKKKEDPCKKVSTRALRNAQVSDELMVCHSKKAVKDIYGSPSRIHSWAKSEVYDTQWDYHFESGTSIFIYFKNNKVTDWSYHY